MADKASSEQMRFIAELHKKDKSIVLGMIETMLTKKKLKAYCKNNIAVLKILNIMATKQNTTKNVTPKASTAQSHSMLTKADVGTTKNPQTKKTSPNDFKNICIL